MDVIFDLLKQLLDALGNPLTFLLDLALITMATFFLTKMAVRSIGKGGFLSIFFKGESLTSKKDSKDLNEIRLALGTIVGTQGQALQQITSLVSVLGDDSKDIIAAKTAIANEIDDIKAWMKTHDALEQQTNLNMRDLMQRSLDSLTKINSELEKIDEYVRASIPEFKMDNREIQKGIAELSKDIALIERTIQAQMNTHGIKLK
jgi:hypothetical protein